MQKDTETIKRRNTWSQVLPKKDNMIKIEGTNYVSIEYFQEFMCKMGYTLELKNKSTPELVTLEQIQKIGYQMRQEFSAQIAWEHYTQEQVDELNEMLNKYNITDKNEICYLLAQSSVESGYGGSKLTEDAGESTYQIRDENDGKRYNRISNWDDPRAEAHPGDSKLYRGGGYIHITWKNHYYDFARQMEKDTGKRDVFDYIINNGADALTNEHYAWESAGWAWNQNLTSGGSPHNTFVENANVSAKTLSDLITKSINGGYNGNKERWACYEIIAGVILGG